MSEHPLSRLVGEDSHRNWIVGVVSFAIVALLGGLISLDRDHVGTTADQALAKATAVEREHAVLKARLDSDLRAIKEDVAEIKQILRERGTQ